MRRAWGAAAACLLAACAEPAHAPRPPSDAGVVDDVPRTCERFDGTEWCWENPLPNGLAPTSVLAFADGPDVTVLVASTDRLSRADGSFFAISGGGECRQMSGVAPDDVWLACDGGLYHFDGRVVSRAAYAGVAENHRPRFYGVWVPAVDDVWATSDDGMHHWNGARWDATPMVFPPHARMHGTSSSDVWAGGFHFDGVRWNEPPSEVHDGLVPFSLGDEVWMTTPNGLFRQRAGVWQAMPLPEALDLHAYEVGALYASGPDDVWAVLSTSDVLHFDGAQWTANKTLPTSARTMSGLAANDIWIGDAAGGLHHYDGASWSTPRAAETPLGHIVALHASSTHAVALEVDTAQNPPAPSLLTRGADGSWRRTRPLPTGTTCMVAVDDDELWLCSGAALTHIVGDGPEELVPLAGFFGTENVFTMAMCATSKDLFVHLSIDEHRTIARRPLAGGAFEVEQEAIEAMSCVGDEVWIDGAHRSADGTWTRLTRSLNLRTYARAPDDVWALGNDGLEHFDGVEWLHVPLDSSPWSLTQASAPDRAFWLTSPTGEITRVDRTGHPVALRTFSVAVQPIRVWPLRDDDDFDLLVQASDGSLWHVTSGQIAMLAEARGTLHFGAWIEAGTGFLTVDGGLLSWDGEVLAPVDGVSDVFFVEGFAADDVWALGTGLWHFDGADWRMVNADILGASLWRAGDALLLADQLGHAFFVDRRTGALSLLSPHDDVAWIGGTGADDLWVTAGGIVHHFDGIALTALRVPEGLLRVARVGGRVLAVDAGGAIWERTDRWTLLVRNSVPRLQSAQVIAADDIWTFIVDGVFHFDGRRWSGPQPLAADIDASGRFLFGYTGAILRRR